MLKVATAFSGGFGSVEFALKYLNIEHEIVFAVEYMKPQRDSYINNHGEPTDCFYKDIKEFTGTKYKGEIDYFHLSPPCQSYSLAGSRGGAADERGGLMFEAIRAIDEVQPKMFSVENVRGLLSSNGGEDWKNIMRDFKSLKGYTVSWGIMNAKEQGTPQNRERVFIVGFRGDGPLFDFPQRQPLKYKLFDLLEDDVDKKYFLSKKMLDGFILHKYRHKKKGNGFGIKYKDESSVIASAVSCKAGSRATDNYIQISSNTKSGYEVAKDGDGISLSRPTSTTRRWRVGKSVAQTLDTSSSQGVLLKSNIRRLTPRECARVQGDFQDMFKLDCFSDTKLYEFIGNAMDISTTKNLISKMLKFLEKIKLNEPIEPTFVKKERVQTDLFGEVA